MLIRNINMMSHSSWLKTRPVLFYSLNVDTTVIILKSAKPSQRWTQPSQFPVFWCHLTNKLNYSTKKIPKDSQLFTSRASSALIKLTLELQLKYYYKWALQFKIRKKVHLEKIKEANKLFSSEFKKIDWK